MLKENGLELAGECASQWNIADAPQTEIEKDYDGTLSDMQEAGDLFTPFFKQISPLTSDC